MSQWDLWANTGQIPLNGAAATLKGADPTFLSKVTCAACILVLGSNLLGSYHLWCPGVKPTHLTHSWPQCCPSKLCTWISITKTFWPSDPSNSKQDHAQTSSLHRWNDSFFSNEVDKCGCPHFELCLLYQLYVVGSNWSGCLSVAYNFEWL